MPNAAEQLSAIGINVSDLVDAIEAEQLKRRKFAMHKSQRPPALPPLELAPPEFAYGPNYEWPGPGWEACERCHRFYEREQGPHTPEPWWAFWRGSCKGAGQP